MKIRSSFVSNSSSCSFMINKLDLTSAQFKKIKNHINVYNKWLKSLSEKQKVKFFGKDKNYWPHLQRVQDTWSINETVDNYAFSTDMTNFPMIFFLENIIGVNVDSVIREFDSSNGVGHFDYMKGQS